jgi:hypothetical protein
MNTFGFLIRETFCDDVGPTPSAAPGEASTTHRGTVSYSATVANVIPFEGCPLPNKF